MPVVRSALAADAAALAEVAAATFPLACPPGTSDSAIRAFIDEHLSRSRFAGYLADPGRAVLLAEDEAGQAVGYSMLVLAEPTDPDVAAVVRDRPSVELSKLYVRAEQHGSGTSHTLMAATVQRAADEGAQCVWLGVNQRNARAQRFYGKSGFEVAGEKTFLVGPELHHDFVMVRRVGPGVLSSR